MRDLRWLFGSLLSMGLAVGGVESVEALSITFEKVADTATSIPGGSGSFTSFGRNPSIDAGVVAFRGDGEATPTPADPTQQGIYSTTGGSLGVVADQNTAIPGGAGNFETFTFKPSVDGTSVAWNGDGAASQEGIYRDTGSGALLVADRTTFVPGGTTGEVFDSFVFAPVATGGDVVFHGVGDGGVAGPDTEGIYRLSGGTLSAVVDSNDLTPGSGEAFAFLSTPDLDAAGNVVFRGSSATGFHGVYRHDGALQVVADETTASPSSGLLFQSFGGDPAVSGGVTLFRGNDSAGLTGLYKDDGGLLLVADENTAIPEGGGGNFNLFGNYTLDGDVVVFEGIGTPGVEIGLYTDFGGSLAKIIDLGDSLDGKSIAELEISRESLSGDQLVFWARFTDNSEGVFVANIPEPGTAGLFALGLALLACHRRQR